MQQELEHPPISPQLHCTGCDSVQRGEDVAILNEYHGGGGGGGEGKERKAEERQSTKDSLSIRWQLRL